ncbi:hypothetical protein KAH27_03465 [bacterium]|nr:hypothetical protein [bacterium]
MYKKSKLSLLIIFVMLTTISVAFAKQSFKVEKITFSNNTPPINSQIDITVTIKNTSTGKGTEPGSVVAHIGIQRPDKSKFYLQPGKLNDIKKGKTKKIVFKFNTGFVLGRFRVSCDLWDSSKSNMYYTTGFNYELAIEKKLIRAMWVWHTEIISGGETGVVQLLDFCLAPHNNKSKKVSLLYLYINPKTMKTNNRSLRNFIKRASDKGISVHALYGIIPWPGGSNTIYDVVDYVLEYNKQCPLLESRFKGVHLDHEFWEKDKFEKYKNFINGLKSHAFNSESMNSQNLALGLDTGEEWESYHKHYLSELFATPDLDFITVMSYRDHAADIISWTSDEITAGEKYGKTVFAGVETHRPNPDLKKWPHHKNTFYEEGNDKMEDELAKVDYIYSDRQSYIGTTIHFYQAYYKLPDSPRKSHKHNSSY